jgi:hypothetical protein
LGCKPQSADGNGENDRDLTDEEIWLRHARPPDESGVAGFKKENRLINAVLPRRK